ncbi:hypothetical protein A5681_18225 [Mycobacterium scrofulaceum]|uniref:PPE family protein n=1 Tax=Mycobacterium scrofulaceum TaxID=1783 RepID=UPI0007FE9EB4|nr:PPE family protein [Mycobacterium scrofulaceum]OBH85125.1 hypothetical protein A5681_18225 [Mycobacterium scrofulaceum]
MDFGALPPETNSGRMYVGPGGATLLAASSGWDSLAIELNSAAGGYESVITTLTATTGPTSASMAAAVTPYVVWLRAVAGLCEQSAAQATAASAAYDAAYAMTVPPPLIATNRVSTGAGAASGLASALGGAPGGGDAAGLLSDVAGLGSDAAGFGADGGGVDIDLYGLGLDYRGLDLDYQGLALDMEGAGSILGAEGGPALHGAPALGGLGHGATASLGRAASASLGQGTSLGTLSVPPGWANATSSVTPMPTALDAKAMPGGWGAAPPPATGVSKMPLGGMVGRESGGVVHRIGFRPSLIPRSPVAG